MSLQEEKRLREQDVFKPKKLALLGGKKIGDDNENLFLSNCLKNSTCETFAQRFAFFKFVLLHLL